MICESYSKLTPIEASTYIGKLVHLFQNDEIFFEYGKLLIGYGEQKGLFDGVKINPQTETKPETG